MAGVIKVGQVWRCQDGTVRQVRKFDGGDGEELPFLIGDYWFSREGVAHGAEGTDLIELVQDENGFTIWRGGECPVPADAVVTVRFRQGHEASGKTVGEWDWDVSGSMWDIVAYKVLEQQPAAAPDPKDMAADMLSDLGWHFDGTTWVQDGEPASVETPDSALAVQIGGSHYKDLAIQPIEYIHANKLGFCEGNVVKYITRHRQKHGADDIRKVIHYCQLLLELEYGGAK